MVFGRVLRLPCDLVFGAPPDKEQSTTDYTADLVERLHDIHHFACQHLKVASDRMKARYNQRPARLVTKKSIECGCTALPGREDSHPNCRLAGRVAITLSPGSMTLHTEFSGIPGER